MQKKETVNLPMTTIHAVSTIGPYHADINFKNSNGTIRGPFDIRDVKPGAVPTYPVLWRHDADRERTMCFEGDSEAQHKKGKNRDERELIDLKAAAVWASASHCHFNQNFRFNSQSTAIQFTPRKTIGGRAWTSVALASEDQGKRWLLWGNTTLGVLVHWYHSNKQQSGRGNITPTALESLAVWDVTALTSTQLERAAKLEICPEAAAPHLRDGQRPCAQRTGRELLPGRAGYVRVYPCSGRCAGRVADEISARAFDSWKQIKTATYGVVAAPSSPT